jgi:tetratricopeptide (TPR) repeat protein
MFSVPRPRKAIPQIKNVPLTKEEIRRRKMVRTAIIGAIVLAALIAAFLAYRANHRRAIEAARVEAEATGRLAAIEQAIDLLDGESGPGDIALLARLHASAELAGAPGHREPALALLDRHDPSGEGASDHRIAQTYLALASGDPDEATRESSLLVAGRGPRAAEAGHALARARLAAGNFVEARAAADAAHAVMPDAPRHRALLVEVASRGGGDPPDASGDDTVVRLARARAAIESLASSAAIRADAQAVLDATDATPAERGWAELAVGVADAIDGDTIGAWSHLRTARDHRPPGDELFTIELAETLFDVGRRLEAAEAMQPLTNPVSTDASRRSLLTARQALLAGDPEAAARAAEAALDTPRRALILGRIAAMRGQVPAARAAFETAAASPALASYAHFDLVELLLHSSDPPGALASIREPLAAAPTHPRLAAAAAYAFSATGQSADAFTALGRAQDAHEGEPLVLVCVRVSMREPPIGTPRTKPSKRPRRRRRAILRSAPSGGRPRACSGTSTKHARHTSPRSRSIRIRPRRCCSCWPCRSRPTISTARCSR